MSNKEAIKYLNMIRDSFNPETAPRFSKEAIGGERERAALAIARAIQLLEGVGK